jgi:DNA damage-binding protein 1
MPLDTGELLREVARAEVGAEIACLDCSPLGDPGAAAATLAAVGLWSMEVQVLSMPVRPRVYPKP